MVSVGNGEQAVDFFTQHTTTLVLLDLNLPDFDGLNLATLLRINHKVPVLMMSVRDSPEQRLAGFEAGAVDYLVKPFHPGELLFRFQRVLRANPSLTGEADTGADTAGKKILRYGSWRLDVHESLLSVGTSAPIKLTAGQADVVSLLICAQGRTVSKEVLQHAVARGWGGNSKTVGVLISRLRNQLAQMSGNTLSIEAVYGIGYRLSVLAPE